MRKCFQLVKSLIQQAQMIVWTTGGAEVARVISPHGRHNFSHCFVKVRREPAGRGILACGGWGSVAVPAPDQNLATLDEKVGFFSDLLADQIGLILVSSKGSFVSRKLLLDAGQSTGKSL